MPRRPPKTDPELQAHKEWLGYLQPRGLVVAPAAMWEAGWVLEQSGKELLERQEQFREALLPLAPDEDVEDDQPQGFRRLEALLVEQLSWDADALQRDESTLQIWTRDLPELGETLAPTAVVRGFGADDKPQLLIQELPEPEEGQLPPGEPVDFDRRQASGDQGWRASPQERFERLLRETEVQLGLLFNGAQLRLVVAPKGESSGHLTFTLAELAQVSGRAMFAGLRLLARLSLWLVTLSKHLPFTFVDHALKEGDSLVGMSMERIDEATKEIQLGLFDGPPRSLLQNLAKAREAVFSVDSRSDADAERKQAVLEEHQQASDTIRQVGDLLVAAFFQGGNAKARANREEETIRELNQGMSAEQIKAIRTELAAGTKGIRPFHWELEFPEVFQNGRGGFDAFVGNPPFAGKSTIAEGSPAGFLDWLKQLHPESHGNADLVAHFFRRCFDLLRPEGAMGLIATNTIAQGDTRSTGLRWICLNGGTIVAARKRCRWPGVAAMVVSIVHVLKGLYSGERTLDGRRVEQITAFLFDKGGHEDPKPLKANAGKSFHGSIVLGMGFTFDDSGESDDDMPGIPSPIATMERLIAANPKNAEVIFPYIGGKEVNDSPTHAHHRYVINFGDRSEEECRRGWPELMGIVERKVKPGRLENNRENYSRYWWQFAEKRVELVAELARANRVLTIPCISNTLAFASLGVAYTFSHKLIVLPLEHFSSLALLQARVHEFWARFFASSMKDDLNYSPSDCFETFPFPTALIDASDYEPTQDSKCQYLVLIGERYHQFRAELMVSNNEGLTSTYNRFHDPAETSDGILELRRLHDAMDQAVLAAYGWSDALPTATDTTPDTSPCGFGLDYLDTEDDALLPPDLQERIASGDLFFPTASEACSFQAQLRRYGAVKASRRLAWRHRWPDAIRDDVLARLLALNAERHAEEQAMGLQGKGGKVGAKPAKATATAGATRRGRPAKGSPASQNRGQRSEQMGLGL